MILIFYSLTFIASLLLKIFLNSIFIIFIDCYYAMVIYYFSYFKTFSFFYL